MPFRPPAVPIVTVDPYFSIWSCADSLHHDQTRHWTMEPHSLVGLVRVDGRTYRFLGSANTGPDWKNSRHPSGMRQTACEVHATRTVARFEDGGIELTATFCTPLLPDDLDLLARPFSYVEIEVCPTDGREHSIELALIASPAIAAGDDDALLVWEEASFSSGWRTMRTGTWQQNVLGHRGDLNTINWGYFHLITDQSAQTRFAELKEIMVAFGAGGVLPAESISWKGHGTSIRQGAPHMAAAWQLGHVSAEATVLAVLGYDDVASIDYFGTPTPAWCFRNGATFSELAERAVHEWAQIHRRAAAFDTALAAAARESGDNRYADLVALAWRQSIAAHKLVADERGLPAFLSKECTSNGSIGTVDVSYPSIPLYLLYAPELVAGMLRPVLRFAASDAWQEKYAPHDVGTYPRATGQTYGMWINTVDPARQMPVEECGNMLIMIAAHMKVTSDPTLASEHLDLLRQWAEYLIAHGLDPENQLCTDDFAGHLARNANLSIKAIMGIACYGMITNAVNGGDGARYLDTAREYAARWQEMAGEGGHTRLTFNGEGTWSLKYNLIWDRFFGFNLFPQSVAESEVSWYLDRADRYGTPMDSRAAFTKTDWLVWAASLTTDRQQRDAIIGMVWDYANETHDRTPFSDWYDTHDAREQSFHNRSVIGGIYMPMLMDRLAAPRDERGMES